MGQKTNPIGFRLGIIKSWESRWFSEKDYSKLLQEDINIRKFLLKKLSSAGISKVVIERPAKLAKITIHTSRPGVIIGKKGSDIEKLKKDIGNITEGDVSINIVEIKKPELDSQLVADNIAQQLERRVAFRRAMKRAVQSAMRLGALGIRVNCSGRLGGAEIARTEWYREGRVPLHTLRADIDYGVSRANTTYGICGVKVWIFKGEKFDKDVNDVQKDKPSNDLLKKGRGIKICCNQKNLSLESNLKVECMETPREEITLTLDRLDLKALTPARITSRQIESARRCISRHLKRSGKVWIRIFPDVPVTKKPAEVRQGKGKGAVEFWAARVKPGKILFEIDGVSKTLAEEAFELASAKLPNKNKFVIRLGL